MSFIRLFQGNNLDFIKTIPDNSINFVYTDPPYLFPENQKMKTIAYEKDKQISEVDNRHRNKNQKIRDNNLENGIDQTLYFKELYRVQKKELFQMVIWCNDHQLTDYLILIKEYGLKFKLIEWIKTNPMPQNNPYLNDKEHCIYIYKKSIPSYLDNFDSKRTFFHTRSDRESPWHPTTKPYKIVVQQILKHTKEGDVVFDPFLESGTTALACMQNNRNFYGCEIQQDFFKKTIERLNENLDIVTKLNGTPIEVVNKYE